MRGRTSWCRTHEPTGCSCAEVVVPWLAGQPARLIGRTLEDDATPSDAPLFDPPGRAVLVAEGIFLHRPELVHLWHTSAWLDAPLEVAFARCVQRDGWDPRPEAHLRRVFFGAEDHYLRLVEPRRRASVVLDVTDVLQPRWVRGVNAHAC